MEKVQTTLRIDKSLKERVVLLSKMRAITFNSAVNNALRDYLRNDSVALKQELEASLEALDMIAEKDPGFEQSLKDYVAAEVAMEYDPVEGKILDRDKTGLSEKIGDILGG